MTFNQVLTVLRARRTIAVRTFGGVIVAVVLITLIWPSQYTAKTTVVVDNRSDPSTTDANGAGGGGQTLPSYVNTQADIIDSVRVGQRAVKQVKLDESAWARRRFSDKPGQDVSAQVADYLVDRKLTVAPLHDSPTHGSNVIEIDVKWYDPVTAAALANAVAQAAIDTNIELKVSAAKQYASWFEQRATALRADLQTKQKRLSDFQTAHGLVATDEKLDVENARLQELSTDLVTIETQRQDAQSRQRQVGADNESLPEVLQSPVIQSLKAALAAAEAKKQDVEARVGKNHPDYVAVDTEIANLQRRITQESASIAASLGATTQASLRREHDIQVALEEQKKRVLDLKHQHDEATVLESDVTAAQRDLDAVTLRLAQSNLEGFTQQTNVVQLAMADPPNKPSSPNLLLNLVLAIFLGGMAAVGVAFFSELRDPRVREEDEMAALLGVPLLGAIRSAKSSSGGWWPRSAPRAQSSGA
jgi:chain length determinant protein EpsF